MEAGQSRIYGGIHFKSGNEHGRILGRQVGQRLLQGPAATSQAEISG